MGFGQDFSDLNAGQDDIKIKGGTDSTVIGNIADTLMVAQSATNYFASTVNSTDAQLAVSQTFTGVVETAFNQQSFSVLLVSDQAGTLTILQYIDAGGTQLIQTLVIDHLAGIPIARSGVINGNYIKTAYKNTGLATTTTLKLDIAYGTIPSATQLNNNPVSLNEVNGTAIRLGQVGMAASLPVVLSSDQSDVFKMYELKSEFEAMNKTLRLVLEQLIFITEQEED
jgi:hypothetical protein